MENIDLSELCKTQSEALNLKVAIGNVIEKIYEENFDLEKVLLAELGIEKKDKLISLLANYRINLHSNSDPASFFEKIKDQVVNLPVVTLVIAFEPNAQTLKKISDWFILNLKKQVLLDVKINRQLIAGAAVQVNGKYLDFSVRSKFDEVLQENIKTFSNVTTPLNNAPVQDSLKN